jgi:hypothetical protein
MQQLRNPQNKITRIESAAENDCVEMFEQASVAAQ